MKRKRDDHSVAGPISAAAKPLFVPKQRDKESALRSRQDDTERIEQTFLSQPRSSIDSHQKPSDSNRHRRTAIEKELDLIKEQYFGSDKPKKRVIIKPSEKFRFSFDWEISDDTSRDPNSLYQNPHEARPLFGRGFLAGIDRREQRKSAAMNEKKVRERLDRHWSEKNLEEMTERDWRIFREDFDISYKGGSKIPRPMRNWAESELTHELLRAVERSGYQNPTRIQMAAVPLCLHQRDIIGIAETGSGKTAAFVLPMLNLISKLSKTNETNKTLEEEEEGPIALVLAPTRELAQQIENETLKLARYLRVRVSSIVGGRSIEEQGLKISRGCEIVIATPGRLIDCLERRFIVLNRCSFVVLDEADRMTDMGFEPQLVRILDSMATSLRRTTLMFSATMTPPAERLARKYLENPIVVNIGNPEKATDFITQRVSMVRESEKFFRLKRLLDELGDKTTAIVFVNTKTRVDSVARDLDKSGYRVTAFRGGKSQEQRELSLEGFRAKRFNVLVATDAAGRGIDVPDVGLVVNYDMPGNIQTYTHRIGRTGRAGRTGDAITFLTPNDSGVFYDLKQMLVQSNCHVPRELANHEAAKFKPGTVTR